MHWDANETHTALTHRSSTSTKQLQRNLAALGTGGPHVLFLFYSPIFDSLHLLSALVGSSQVFHVPRHTLSGDLSTYHVGTMGYIQVVSGG